MREMGSRTEQDSFSRFFDCELGAWSPRPGITDQASGKITICLICCALATVNSVHDCS